MINKKICKKIIIIFVISLATILLKSNFSNAVTICESNNCKIIVNLNLTNAPFGNDEYCESKLNKGYTIKLAEGYNQSNCTNYPTKVEFEDRGILNEETHTYTRNGVIDFSKTSFESIGDYYFDLCDENGKNIYQIIVSFKYLDGEIASQIFTKSVLLHGEKVDKIDINFDNPNTYLQIKKEKDKNAIAEEVFVDVSIYSYNNDSFTILKNNQKQGIHNVIRKENNEIAKQTYSLINDDVITIGKEDELQVPVGTKYKVEKMDKNYREQYDVTFDGELRIAQENTEENLTVIKNLTHTNPKTGVFYTVIPFATTIVVAVIGIIIIKKTTSNEDENNES